MPPDHGQPPGLAASDQAGDDQSQRSVAYDNRGSSPIRLDPPEPVHGDGNDVRHGTVVARQALGQGVYVPVRDSRELSEPDGEMSEPATPLLLARGAVPARPTGDQRLDCHPGTGRLSSASGVGRDDDAADLVPAQEPRSLIPPGAAVEMQVAAAYPSGVHAHQDLARTNLGHGNVPKNEIAGASGKCR
jgi:hypothetical protein